MSDGDVFSPLGRGYATAGRQLALGLAPETVARTVLYALRDTLNQSRLQLPPLFSALQIVLAAARNKQERSPLLASDPRVAYEHWQRARDICRNYRNAQGPLADVAEGAIVQALVDERRPTAARRPPIATTFAHAFVTQLFEQRFAGKVETMAQSQGVPAQDARRRTEECRAALLAAPQFAGLVKSLARNPGRRHRLYGMPSRRQTTAQVPNQSLGSLLSSAGGTRP